MLRTPARLLLLAFLGGVGMIEAQVDSGNPEQRVVAAVEGGAVEPTVLPANIETPGHVSFDPPAEPPLPLPEGPDAPNVVELESPEVAAIPRRFRYAITVEARGVYDDNITLSSGSARRSDYSGQLTANLLFGVGDVLERQANYLSVNYSPTGYLFAENSDFNTVEHIFNLQGRWRPGRFAFTLTQSFQSVRSTNLGVANELGGFNNQANLDVGGRRRISTYATRLEAAGDLTGKTSLQLGASYQLVEPQGLISTETISGSIGVGYAFGAKMQLGIQFTVGQNFVEAASPDQTFEQLTVRGSYEISGKLRASGSGGVEFRQSDDAGQGQFAPVFQASLSYTPFDGTSLALAAIGRTLSSASSIGQDFTSTQFTVTAQQRFFQRVFASFSAGYQTQSYFATLRGVETGREDNYFFLAPGIDVRLTNFWFAGIYYVHRQNDSTVDFFTFDDNQIGIRSNVQF